MQRDDSWPNSVRFGLAAAVLSLLAYFVVARETAPTPLQAVATFAPSNADSPSAAAPTPGPAETPALAAGQLPPQPVIDNASSKSASPDTGTARPPAPAAEAASDAPAASASGAQPFHRNPPGIATPGHDYWLESAQGWSADCCWGSLLHHTLEWTRAQPERALAWSYLGLAQWHNYKFDEARAAHEKALSLAPGDYFVLVQAANFRFARNEPTEAAQLYRRATDADGSIATAWTGLGNAYALLADHEQAIANYRHSLAINAGDADVQRVLGDEYYHTNRFAEAIATYQQALALDPGDARVKEALARAKQR
jgi:tetratricopeptide (TPR) repeat protein